MSFWNVHKVSGCFIYQKPEVFFLSKIFKKISIFIIVKVGQRLCSWNRIWSVVTENILKKLYLLRDPIRYVQWYRNQPISMMITTKTNVTFLMHTMAHRITPWNSFFDNTALKYEKNLKEVHILEILYTLHWLLAQPIDIEVVYYQADNTRRKPTFVYHVWE